MARAQQAAKMVKETVREASFMEARNESDTIRLWESYKDQAILWRSLALLQIPTTLIAIIFTVMMWHTRKITLNVPREPLPGVYSASDIPDQKFVEAATEFLNLIATYTPVTARPQFVKAHAMLVEPLLGKYESEMLNGELKQIEGTGRTQVFFTDPSTTVILREDGSTVHVQMDGSRVKILGGTELPPESTRFIVTLTTVPRNILNPYGIVISNVQRGVPSTEESTKKGSK